jgi:hypothetical protein
MQKSSPLGEVHVMPNSEPRATEATDASHPDHENRDVSDQHKGGSPQAKQNVFGSAKAASAALADEVLAREALEGIKRIRAKARTDKIALRKPDPTPVRPAVIVAKAPQPHPPWLMPIVTLGLAVIVTVCACTGFIAYLTMRPGEVRTVTGGDIRNLRETVTQLRHQVTSVSEHLDGLRTAVDVSSKATSDRFGRVADNLDRIERANSTATARIEKIAEAQTQATLEPQPIAKVASIVPSVEATGSVSSPEKAKAPRRVVRGWSVRQAYEGIAILQGPAGVVEVVLGQDVPGLGRIEEMKIENGQLVVLSSAGTIVPARKQD